MTDFSFIKLYKNDFASAQRSDNTNIVTMPYAGFIQQKTNETFCQKTNCSDGVVFVGGIKVELIDGCGNVQKDITDNFYYFNYESENGTEQIDFEFGNINEDFGTLALFLKITDLDNGNIWYSNAFCVTDYRSEFSSVFHYTNDKTIFGIDYTTSKRLQIVRIGECYDHTPVNQNNLKQYTTSNGNQVNYNRIVTFLRQYQLNNIDIFCNDRLDALFSHSHIYIDFERVVVSDYKVEERKGDTNWFDGSFIVNKQNEVLNYEYQLFEGLEVVEQSPINGAFYSGATFDTFVLFNKNIDALDGDIKLFKDGLFVTNATYVINDNVVLFEFGITFTNGFYSIVFPKANKGIEVFNGYALNEWTFTIADGEFDNTEFDNTEFLTT